MYQVYLKQQLQIISMKAKLYQSRLQQQLTSNYNICQIIIDREGVNAGKPLIKYQQFMYLILNGRIPISKIAYFRNKKYINEEPLLRRTFLVQDGIRISMEVVEKAWRFQRSSEKISTDLQKGPDEGEKQIITHHSTMNIRQGKETIENLNKQQIDHENIEKMQKEQSKRHIKSVDKQEKSKKDQRHSKKVRIEELKQTLAMVQSKINSSKNEQQILAHQKEYNKYFKELQYLRNQKRIEKEKRLLKKIEEDNNKCSSVMKKLSELLDQMNKIKAGNAKILDKLPSYEERISKTEQINRISAIFSHYARKQVGSSQRYFGDMEKQISHLNLQTFVKFVHDWHLNRILTLDKITNIFKIRSKGKKSVNIFQFNQIISDIHVHQCIAEQKSFTNESNSHYIQEYIVNQSKMNKILLNRSKNTTEPLKSAPNQQHEQMIKNKKVSSYKFKPKPYSGKYIHDIKQQLMSKKQMIDFLAGPKNAIKYQNKHSLNLRSNTVENSKIEIGTIEASLYNPTVSVSDSINNSYAFQFKLKKNKKRYKTEDMVQGQIKNEEGKTELYEQNRQNINNRGQIKSRYQEGQNSKKNTMHSQLLIENSQQERAIDNLLANLKGDKYNINSFVKNQQLEDLINESEEDQYLKKFILPPIKEKKLHKYVHY